MKHKTKILFDSKPYQKAILEIQALENRILKEIRQEAEHQDHKKETADPSSHV